MDKWIVQTDGGCPANPGPGAFAFVLIKHDGNKVCRSGFLPMGTNNTFEYRAVTAAALFLGAMDDLPERIDFWSDSEVIVRQLNGVYQVKNESLRPFYQEAAAALTELRKRTKVVVNWFRREFNMEADELCNTALAKRNIFIASKKRKV